MSRKQRRVKLPYPSRLGSMTRGRCPGRYRLESNYPEPKNDSPAAKRGKLLHDLVASKLEGKTIQSDSEGLILIDRCIDWAERKGIDGNHGIIAIEEDIEIKGIDNDVAMRGRADLVMISAEGVTVVDWKFSREDWEDDEFFKAQLYAYLLGAMQRWGKRSATGWIYLPGPDVEYELRTTFEEAKDYVFSLLRSISQPDAPRRAGHWCHYCTALPYCPEAKAKATKMIEIAPIVEASSMAARKREYEAALETLPAETILEMGRQLEVVEPLVAAVRARIKECVEADIHPYTDEWEIRSRSVRSVPSANDLWHVLQDYMSQDEFSDCATVSLTKLESAWCERSPKKKSEAKKEFEEVTASAVDVKVQTYMRRKASK